MSDLLPPPPYVANEGPPHSTPPTARQPPLPERIAPHNEPSSTVAPSVWSPPPYLHPYGNSVAPTSPTVLLHDPRSSSQASLLPTASGSQSDSRTLLLVYIHGFLGNETSFQSFPAHLHNLLTVTLGSNDDSLGYLVHTKVYPKFKTRHQINVATLEFSQWLSAFENGTTDIVLIGHSMGGILAAEVVLLHSFYSNDTRRHPGILGVIAFDTPFLGMHPGIISSGIASLFRPAPTPATAAEESTTEAELDPLFSQRPQRNFTVVPSQKPENLWESTLHFIRKHHENLTQATGKYLMSHLEFGACLADPIGLQNRYTKIRRLEDGEQLPDGRVDRVRFANYYTISYGLGKTGAVVQPPLPVEMADGMMGGSIGVVATGLEAAMSQMAQVGGEERLVAARSHSRTPSGSSMGLMHELPPGRLSVAPSRPEPAHPQRQDITPETAPLQGNIAHPSVGIIPPSPISPQHDDLEVAFPALSALPTEPTLPEIPENADKHLRKALEKENKRLQKEHERQMKEHAKLAKGREKAIAHIREGREKERGKHISVAQKQQQKERQEKENQEEDETERLEKQRQKEGQDIQTQEENHRKLGQKFEQDRQKQIQKVEQDRQKQIQKEEQEQQREKHKLKKKPPRQRKFCIVPSQPDKTWTPVEMKGVDEVGAHCGLFFVGEVYAKLVGDVAGRIEEWVGEEQTRRLLESGRGNWTADANNRNRDEKLCGSGYGGARQG